MQLLYLDDAGSVIDSGQKYYALGGFSVFERQTHWVSQDLDKIVARFTDNPSEVELHGNPMVKGSGFWRKKPREDRVTAFKDALSVLGRDGRNTPCRAFVAVINKEAASPHDPIELAFEQIASRFDQYLLRLHRNGDTQRGIMICDKSTSETSLQSLATEFKEVGHRWGES